ncbi:prolyl oligopeptidase family serine peptidase [Alteromonas sp. 14N.309.X.WAT.G.H12]|uniref:prolyl oligopeptidase family serine peptidase n=1 Tax=Alteromonas sp. 14N.309.X.WAT.G.H12 TaxID=3120824 RepID=UPI003A59926C
MGPRPTILYGYGGFSQSIMPRFSDAQAAWIEAGGNYVIANIRGGSEFGKEWHRQGQRYQARYLPLNR